MRRCAGLVLLVASSVAAAAAASNISAPLEDNNDEVTEEQEVELGVHLVLISYSLVALIGVAIWAESRHIPSSVAAIVVGCLLGLIMRLAGADGAPALGTIHALLFFNEEIFLYFLLPPIIFEAGFSLSKRHFFLNLATILLFAVVGTLATTVLIGGAAQALGAAGWFRAGPADALDFSNPKDAFTFGALISATDPVATLSIMGAFNVEPIMFTLVAGESVLNDAVSRDAPRSLTQPRLPVHARSQMPERTVVLARSAAPASAASQVAIVLVRILNDLGKSAFETPSSLLLGVGMFVGVSFGSLLCGVAIAASSALLLKRVDLSHHAALELSLLLLMG